MTTDSWRLNDAVLIDFYEKKTNSWFSNKCECFVNSRLSKMNESMPNETETLRLFLDASKMKISGEYL